MNDDVDPGEQPEQSSEGTERSERGQAGDDARLSDELACRLAYECGWRLCGDALKTLESQRTRAFTLLSVTMVAAGIATSAFLRDDMPRNLDQLGKLGLVTFGVGTLVVMACAAAVAWPIKTEAALRPARIVANYVTPQHPGRTPTWVHKNLARDLDKAYAKMDRKLKTRNVLYMLSVGCVPVVLVGAGMVVRDVVW